MTKSHGVLDSHGIFMANLRHRVKFAARISTPTFRGWLARLRATEGADHELAAKLAQIIATREARHVGRGGAR